MKGFYVRPQLSQVMMQDSFWTPYVEGIRDIMIPYCFEKFYEIGYVHNFESVANQDSEKHIGPPFSDGLVLETITGASNFLALHYQEELDRKVCELIDLVIAAQQEDGYLHTVVVQNYPERKWGIGEGGDIIIQHDLYNQGALIEAAIADYEATKRTKLLKAAVKCANNICAHIGDEPKKTLFPVTLFRNLLFLHYTDYFVMTKNLRCLNRKIMCEKMIT